MINIGTVKSKLINTSNGLLKTINSSEMDVTMGNEDGDFVWGSNAQAANQVVLLIRAYEETKDENYLNVAFKAFDYLVGRNATGYSFVTGHGDLTPLKPHHRISQADGIAAPVPGMLAGGPHPGRQDGCAGYPSTQPAACYVDSWCSYSTNEVTINWNAPLAYAANALSYYQNQSIVNSSKETLQEKKIKIFPNPASNKITIIAPFSNYQYLIVNMDGRIMKKGSGEENSVIDITQLTSGIYTVVILNDGVVLNSQNFIKE